MSSAQSRPPLPKTAIRRGRRPGPGSSRTDVLDAARSLFAEVGFERATIRGIAARASVDPALVHHFFGTKNDLLRAALVLPFNPATLFAVMDEHPGDEGRALVARVLELWGQPQVREQFTALLRVAMSREEAKVALRDVLTRELLQRLESQVGTDDAPLRAALVASQIAGLAMTRFIIGIQPIATSSNARLVAAVGPTIQRYLTGDIT